MTGLPDRCVEVRFARASFFLLERMCNLAVAISLSVVLRTVRVRCAVARCDASCVFRKASEVDVSVAAEVKRIETVSLLERMGIAV